MSKKEQTTIKVKWYKSAKLPWFLILTVAVLFTGFVAGWHANQTFESNQNIDAAAYTQLTEAVLKEKR